jgi:hypothetical protein
MNTLLLIAIILIALYMFNKSKFQDTSLILNTQYSNDKEPQSCNYTKENRTYPSGKFPGSYLVLTPSERKMLLMRFLVYNGSLEQYRSV